jgi:hypothetical protein
VRELPFQTTVDPDTKFNPFTVRVKAVPPESALDGLVDDISGTGVLSEDLLESHPQTRIPIAAKNMTNIKGNCGNRCEHFVMVSSFFQEKDRFCFNNCFPPCDFAGMRNR